MWPRGERISFLLQMDIQFMGSNKNKTEVISSTPKEKGF